MMCIECEEIVFQAKNIYHASFVIDDYICITDMAKAKGGDSRAADIIKTGSATGQRLDF